MKLAHIVPIPDLDLIKDNEIFMALAHLALKDENYRKFYADRAAEGKFVILDNGTAEGSRVEFDQLYRMIHEIQPHEVVLPDELHDQCKTLTLAEDFMDYMEIVDGGSEVEYMLAAQGDTLDEYIECAIDGGNLLGIQTIGASKFMSNKGIDRAEFLIKLIQANERIGVKVDYHVLGLNSLDELETLLSLKGKVRSIDTCFAALFAQNNSGFDNPNWREKKFQFQFEMFRTQYELNTMKMEIILRK